MTVLLVLFTLIMFLSIDYLLQKREQHRARRADEGELMMVASRPTVVPEDILLAPNHLWLKKEKDGSISLGIDDFLASLIGAVEAITLPQQGERVECGRRAILLRDGAATLSLEVPLDGKVVEVNDIAVRHPDIVADHPYEDGWLLRIVPQRVAGVLDAFMEGARVEEWLKQQRESVKQFFMAFTPKASPALLQDGGAPVGGILKHFDETVWEEFERRFLPVMQASGERSEEHHA